MSENSPGYYVDFQFEYDMPSDDVEMAHPCYPVNFSVLIGHTLGEAYEMFKFIANHNMWIPGLSYIRLRLVNDGEITPEGGKGGVVLSRWTPSGTGDW